MGIEDVLSDVPKLPAEAREAKGGYILPDGSFAKWLGDMDADLALRMIEGLPPLVERLSGLDPVPLYGFYARKKGDGLAFYAATEYVDGINHPDWHSLAPAKVQGLYDSIAAYHSRIASLGGRFISDVKPDQFSWSNDRFRFLDLGYEVSDWARPTLAASSVTSVLHFTAQDMLMYEMMRGGRLNRQPLENAYRDVMEKLAPHEREELRREDWDFVISEGVMSFLL